MHVLRRMTGLLVALVLLTSLAQAMPSQAQDPTPTPSPAAAPADRVTIDGSALVGAVLQAARTAYTTANPTLDPASVEINVSGTAGGFEKLCAGTLDMAMAYGPITDAQAGACRAGNVEFVELLLGYDAVVAVVNSTSPATCLSTDQLNTLLAPGAEGVNRWQAIDPALTDVTFNAIYGPPADPNLPQRFLLDRLIAGDGLRTDIQPLTTAAEIADRVNAETNSIGLMSLAEFETLRSTRQQIRALQVKSETGPCIDATVANLDEARYPAAESLYLYVNAASIDRAPVKDFLTYLLSNEGRAAVSASNYVRASAIQYDRGQGYVDTKRTGRTFSRIETVNIPADTSGVINIDGSPAIFNLLTQINTTFSPRFTSITVTNTALGNDAAYRKLCAGQADVIGVTRAPTEAESAACQTSNTQSLELTLGYEAVVVLANTANTAATCLKVDELAAIFGTGATATKWNQVKPDGGDLDLLILMPNEGAAETDFLLNRIVTGQVAPLARSADVTRNADALYRAAGVQNVPGAITFLRYSEFKRNTSQVQAVAIDAGQGCVAPGDETIRSGQYPLAQPLFVRINLSSLTRPEVRAFAWHLISDEALAVLTREEVFGTDTAGFQAARDTLLERFAQIEAAAATPAPTAEATGEATPAATGEAVPTGEATAEPTAAPTAEATAEPTAAPTAEPTPGG